MDLSKVLTLLLAGGKGQRLEPLTRTRPKPAIPFAGVYRIIDFTLSNCLNSGLKKICVLVQYLSITLMRHIRDGWSSAFSSASGEFIETIPPQYGFGEHYYLGTSDAVYQNLRLINREDVQHILILAGDHIYKMNYTEMLQSHIQRDNDITVGAVEVPIEEGSNFGIISIDSSERIINFVEKPREPFPLPDNPKMTLASMGIYVFKPLVLYEILSKDAQDTKSGHDFGKDILPKVLDKYKVYVYRFVDPQTGRPQYWRDVGSIDSFYETNFEQVQVTPRFNLYDPTWPIRTAPVHAPPPKFVFSDFSSGKAGIAINSLISPGCIISGARVESSVLAPNVRVEEYSHIDSSIIFENVHIGKNVKIKNAIIDSNINIPDGCQIGYDLEEDKKRYFVSEKNIVVVSSQHTHLL